ncbi:MAG: tryptophan--tRNA ligase, partial [Candidatus Azambacteria bacterium]|nr:tryptophan--tRNA ligase [Candidatus Azambacteria bacterium]
ISAHSELAWILNCFIPMGWMERMTQFKEKSEAMSADRQGKKERVSVGLFDYPALMAADILLYDTDAVPVGEDQKQHVELTRDVAEKFNSLYGETFKVPEAIVPKTGARVMGLQNSLKKMSKSPASPSGKEDGEKNVIALLDSPDDIKSKIASATTDSLKEIKFDKERPGIYNLLVIYESFTGLPRQEIEIKFEGKGYAEFKNELAEVVTQKLSFIQKRFKEIMADPAYIEKVFENNANKLRPIAEKTLGNVKKKVGLG